MNVNLKDYARSRRERGLSGGTYPSVKKAVDTGRISLNDDGTIDPERADAEWEMNTGVKGGSQMPSRDREAASSYKVARAVRENLQARLIEAKLKRITGELIPSDAVRTTAFSTGRRVRDAVLGVPDRVAPMLASIVDADEIHRLLSTELRAALEGLANEFGG